MAVMPLEFGSYENAKMVRILAEKYDVEARDNDGHTAMEYALL